MLEKSGISWEEKSRNIGLYLSDFHWNSKSSIDGHLKYILGRSMLIVELILSSYNMVSLSYIKLILYKKQEVMQETTS